MGRPKSQTPAHQRRLRVNVMLEPALRQRLRDLALAEDRNFSDQLNRILRDHFRDANGHAAQVESDSEEGDGGD
jgi:hypothetical protein